MMAVIFATLSAALVTGWFGRRPLAILFVAVTLILAVHLFLWEIYSPEYGFHAVDPNMIEIARDRLESLRFFLNEAYMLAMMAAIAAILTAAMVMQYAYGELPCPLCLLQRVAMLGVCFGLMQNFRNGFSDRNLGYSLLFSVFLLVVAVRQTLLDIYPRPGHEYVGSAVLGLHMPVWSILIAVALIAAFAVKLCVVGTEDGARPPARTSLVGRLATVISLYVIAIALINFGSVVVQCGLGQCHTTGYALMD